MSVLVGAGLDITAELLEADPSAVNLVDDAGSTALHLAAKVGDLKSIRYLLASGADSSIENASGRTAASEDAGALFSRCNLTLPPSPPAGPAPKRARAASPTPKRAKEGETKRVRAGTGVTLEAVFAAASELVGEITAKRVSEAMGAGASEKMVAVRLASLEKKGRVKVSGGGG